MHILSDIVEGKEVHWYAGENDTERGEGGDWWNLIWGKEENIKTLAWDEWANKIYPESLTWGTDWWSLGWGGREGNKVHRIPI